ncbi:MAG: hypothetical protein KDI53_17040 [Candidatus Accumulibacter sp.]|nr:hypothetical protein [Accumulibacter sp.]
MNFRSFAASDQHGDTLPTQAAVGMARSCRRLAGGVSGTGGQAWQFEQANSRQSPSSVAAVSCPERSSTVDAQLIMEVVTVPLVCGARAKGDW